MNYTGNELNSTALGDGGGGFQQKPKACLGLGQPGFAAFALPGPEGFERRQAAMAGLQGQALAQFQHRLPGGGQVRPVQV